MGTQRSWQAVKRNDGAWAVYSPLGTLGEEQIYKGYSRSDAQLIAAAPELLDMLKVLRADPDAIVSSGIWERVNAAIARAEGKQP